ncbi:hypothetical protein [Cryobacterium psychrophilum]|uniref:hypothetical protein n=1 Tax=Cryobacterium psychrophilum TaxID=41988 RepID=UPI0010EF02D0|nr:hypothetical protein [Cryobacterium psychrophilum]TDW29988.1 hypothetical protein EDD25_1717 [Cryobacterium psychrophilum]
MSAMNHEPAIPAGEWTHSHEEDDDGILVYRPTESFPFPPTRGGRDSLRVSDDGTIATLLPGPDDRPRPTGYRLVDDTSPDAITVVESNAEILKIRRP